MQYFCLSFLNAVILGKSQHTCIALLIFKIYCEEQLYKKFSIFGFHSFDDQPMVYITNNVI